MVSTIYDDIDKAEIFVAVITRNFYSSSDAYILIRERTHYAIEIGKPLYALVEEGAQLPDYLRPYIILSESYDDKDSALQSAMKLARYHKWKTRA